MTLREVYIEIFKLVLETAEKGSNTTSDRLQAAQLYAEKAVQFLQERAL